MTAVVALIDYCGGPHLLQWWPPFTAVVAPTTTTSGVFVFTLFTIAGWGLAVVAPIDCWPHLSLYWAEGQGRGRTGGDN